jgi:hypothetical protein
MRWPAAYWRDPAFDLGVFEAYLRFVRDEDRARSEQGKPGRAGPVRRFGPPSLSELRDTPWGGEGDDPLERELQDMLEEEGG